MQQINFKKGKQKGFKGAISSRSEQTFNGERLSRTQWLKIIVSFMQKQH